MKEIRYANTGEVKAGDSNTLLNSGAIGSCVVVTIYNSFKKTGAMAHIMLPDADPKGKEFKNTKYAANAISELVTLIKIDQGEANLLETCIIGGANVLKRPNDTIGQNNIDSVEKLLDAEGIKICIKAVGGLERRTVLFDIEQGCVYFTVGDSKQKILWQTETKQ